MRCMGMGKRKLANGDRRQRTLHENAFFERSSLLDVGADMKLSTFCVSDDEPEPTFEIVDAPFRVVECSLSNIEVEYSR